jgi:hypothetical protein
MQTYEAALQMPEYIITTKLGMVPHIIDTAPFPSLNKMLKIYMDDILYKDSFYDKELELPIKKFCCTDKKVAVAFRDKPGVLISKRGHYKLSRKRYMEVVEVLDPDYHADFDTGKVFVDGDEVVEPSDMGDLIQKLKEGWKVFGTQFINDMVNAGKMLSFEDDRVEVREIYDCGCCGELSKGYLRYLWSIKEMNASSYLAIHNYNTLQKIMDRVEDKNVLDSLLWPPMAAKDSLHQ